MSSRQDVTLNFFHSVYSQEWERLLRLAFYLFKSKMNPEFGVTVFSKVFIKLTWIFQVIHKCFRDLT